MSFFFSKNAKQQPKTMAELVEAFTSGAKAIISREQAKVAAEEQKQKELDKAREEFLKKHEADKLASLDNQDASLAEIDKATKFIEKFNI